MIEVLGLAVLGLLVLGVAMGKPEVFGSILVISTFLSRLHRTVAGLDVRLEMVLAGVAGVALLLGPRKREGAPRWPGLPLLFAWLSWLAVTSALHSPSLRTSAAIVVWLALDMVGAYYLKSRLMSFRPLVTTGVWCALVSSLIAIVVWARAAAGHGTHLVQPDPAYGGYAAYVGVIEANILAELLILWAVVALSDRLSGHLPGWVRGALILMSPLVALGTHTRIALVASLLILVFAVARNTVGLRIPAIVLTVISIPYLGGVDMASLGLSKFSKPFTLNAGTGLYRDTTWKTALADLRATPSSWLGGLGANSFGQRHLDPSLPDQHVPWYLGNLPLQLVYDAGLLAGAAALLGIASLLRPARSPATLLFCVVYVLMGTSTSSMWLMQSWVFVGIAVLALAPIEHPEVEHVPASA